jgi:hypothetical protein
MPYVPTQTSKSVVSCLNMSYKRESPFNILFVYDNFTLFILLIKYLLNK